MGYLQNGYCFKSVDLAKADFISRISGAMERKQAALDLSSFTPEQLRVLFPDCVTADVVLGQYLKALITLVSLCLVFIYAKKVTGV